MRRRGVDSVCQRASGITRCAAPILSPRQRRPATTPAGTRQLGATAGLSSSALVFAHAEPRSNSVLRNGASETGKILIHRRHRSTQKTSTATSVSFCVLVDVLSSYSAPLLGTYACIATLAVAVYEFATAFAPGTTSPESAPAHRALHRSGIRATPRSRTPRRAHREVLSR